MGNQQIDVNQKNKCQQTESGDNFAKCSNEVFAVTEQAFINRVIGDGNFDLQNNGNSKQLIGQSNNCDVSAEGEAETFPSAGCENSANSIILGITQSNTASDSSTAADQSNKASFSQEADQRNDCEVSAEGESIAVCDNGAFNVISGITQSNTASDSSTAADQSNKASFSQEADQRNDCGRWCNRMSQYLFQ